MNKQIQGLELYSYSEAVSLIRDFIKDVLYNNGYSEDDVEIHDVQLHGSRLRGQSRKDSDLDAVVEYSGDIREDDLFNMLHEDPMYIDDIEVDINPINSSIDDYMKRSNEYDKHKLNNEAQMRRLTLEERVARLERMLKPVNEADNDVEKILQVILKNLPIFVKNLPTITDNLPKLIETIKPLTEILKADKLNADNNKDKIEKLEKLTELGTQIAESGKQFTDLCEEVIEMFNNIGK